MAATEPDRDASQQPVRRTFIALYPSDEQRREIGRLTARLAGETASAGSGGGDGRPSRPGSDAVRWVPTHQVHLTLAFLGHLPEQQLEEVVRRLEDVASQHAPFDLAFRDVGAFPDARRPKVVWLGVGAGGEAVVDVASHVRTSLRPLGLAPESAPFRPHLTLGRLHRRSSERDLRSVSEAMRSLGGAGTAAAPVHELAVVTSRLGSTGAEHTVIARPPLTGGREKLG